MTRAGDSSPTSRSYIATFSIVARCADTGRFGVAVASRAFAVGSRCPAVRVGVGAVAAQAWIDPAVRWHVLDELARGSPAPDAARTVLAQVAGAEHCQLGVVDASGRAVAHTGRTTMAWSGHRTGTGYATQGNLLAGPDVLVAIEAAFLASRGSLAERLLGALADGEAAGGDRRGRQSAALIVCAEEQFPFVDLRVDDHPNPIAELHRLYRVRSEALASYDRWVASVRAGTRVPLA